MTAQSNVHVPPLFDILNASKDLISYLDKDYIYQAVNDTYLHYWAKSREDIVGKSAAALMGQAVFEQSLKINLDNCLAGETIRYQQYFDFPGMGRRFMDVMYTPTHLQGDKISGVLVSVRDITEIKRTASRYETIFQNSGRYVVSFAIEWLFPRN